MTCTGRDTCKVSYTSRVRESQSIWYNRVNVWGKALEVVYVRERQGEQALGQEESYERMIKG